MKGLENQTYLIGYIISNVVAILMLLAAWKWHRTGRLLFFLLFGWACWINWKTVTQTPWVYLDYADLAFSNWYKHFIRGWFSQHTKLLVGFIATCQGFIAMAMLGRGWIFRAGIIGGIIFLLAILPLGVGAGFPATLIMAAGMYALLRGNPDYLWRKSQPDRERNKVLSPNIKPPVNR